MFPSLHRLNIPLLCFFLFFFQSETGCRDPGVRTPHDVISFHYTPTVRFIRDTFTLKKDKHDTDTGQELYLMFMKKESDHSEPLP